MQQNRFNNDFNLRSRTEEQSFDVPHLSMWWLHLIILRLIEEITVAAVAWPLVTTD